jgi:hypothetical protein
METKKEKIINFTNHLQINDRLLCPRCKSPMTIESKQQIGCMGDKSRVVCSNIECGVVGDWQSCCCKSKFTGNTNKRAWKSWKAERKRIHKGVKT